MKIRKLFMFVAVLLSIIFMLSACKDDNKENNQISLRFSWWGSGVRHEATLAVIKSYMQKNPNVKIIAEYGGWDGYHQKLLTQLAGGTEADIMQVDQPWLAEMITYKNVLDLKQIPEFDGSGFDKDTLVAAGNIEPHVYGLPTGINGFIFVYNKAIEKDLKVKISEAMTWDQVIALGEKVDQYYHGKKQLVVQDVGAISFTVFRRIYAQLTNKHFVTADFKRQITEQEAIQVFKIINELFKNKTFVSYRDIIPNEGNYLESPTIANGRALGAFIYLSQMGILQKANPSAQWDVVAMPQLANSKTSGTFIRPSQVLAVSSKSKYPKEAVKFLNYFFHDPDALQTLGMVRSIPATSNGLQVLNDHKMIDPLIAKAADIMTKHAGWTLNKADGDANSSLDLTIQDALQKMALEKATPEEAAKQFIIAIDNELARR